MNNPFDVGLLDREQPGRATATVQNNTFQEMWQGVIYRPGRRRGSIASNTFRTWCPRSSRPAATTIYEPEGIFALTYGGPAYNVSGLTIVGNTFTTFNGLAISVDGGYQGVARQSRRSSRTSRSATT